MTRGLGRALVLVPGALLFVLVVVYPAAALVSRSISLGGTDAQSIWPTGRQWGLLGRSLWLAGWATVVGVSLSLPAAYVVGRIGRLIRRPVLGALLLAPLLLPPMVYVFGWQRFPRVGVPGELHRCPGLGKRVFPPGDFFPEFRNLVTDVDPTPFRQGRQFLEFGLEFPLLLLHY